MTVSEYAAYLLENFPHDAEVIVKDTGCGCCKEYGLYYVARKPRLVQPVTSKYNDQDAPEEPDEDGESWDEQQNFVSSKPFQSPKVAV